MFPPVNMNSSGCFLFPQQRAVGQLYAIPGLGSAVGPASRRAARSETSPADLGGLPGWLEAADKSDVDFL